WQRRDPRVLHAKLEAWRKHHPEESAPTEFPTDFVRTARTGPGVGGSLAFEIGPAVMSGVRELAKDHGVDPSHVVLTALLVLLRRYVQNDQLDIGVLLPNRPGPPFERMVGLFANVAP